MNYGFSIIDAESSNQSDYHDIITEPKESLAPLFVLYSKEEMLTCNFIKQENFYRMMFLRKSKGKNIYSQLENQLSLDKRPDKYVLKSDFINEKG